MAEEVERSRRALHMEWKIEAANGIKNRGKERKNLHSALEGKYIHGTCLPCTGVHYCTHCCSGQRRPWLSVRLSTGTHQSAGHRCRLPGGHRSTSHWQSSICWQPTFHIIFVAGKLLYGLRHRVPIAPSHTVCFQGMSTCHQRPGLSTVCHKRQYFSVSYFFSKCNSFTIADDSTDQRETKRPKAREKYASMLAYKKGKLMQRDKKVISAKRLIEKLLGIIQITLV